MTLNITALRDFWNELNIVELQKELDVSATELATYQDERDAGRKRLVEISRDFKKNTPDEFRKMISPMLKSFQQEVDTLSKRGKNAEAAFLRIYQKVIELPDPVPTLEVALNFQRKAHRVEDLEIENKQLRETLEDYNNEFADIKNQEVTIKQLKEQVREFEEKLESSAAAKANEMERQLQKKFSEKEREVKEKQLEIAKRLGESEQQVVMLQSALNSFQHEHFELKSKYDETIVAKADEIDMILSDVERASERASAAENENERLRKQLETAQSGDAKSNSANESNEAMHLLKNSSLELELAAKDKAVIQLVEDVQGLQGILNKMRETGTSQIARIEEELANKNRVVEALEKQLQLQSDYAEMKRELAVIKSLEFQTVESDDQTKSLETLLLEKNRGLQNELTQLKMSHGSLVQQNSQLNEQLSQSQATVKQQLQLIGQLEDDLSNVNAMSSIFRGNAEGQAASEEATAIVSLLQGGAAEQTASTTMPDSLLPIVQSQRERYREKAQSLEGELTSQSQQVKVLQGETDKLRSDNVKLYEKIKFLQTYPMQEMKSDETVNSYSAQYEEKLDPFSSFGRKERLRKYMNLKPYDKITLSMGQFIMSNKMARMITFFYTLLLHCMIFVVLYAFAHTESCKRDMAAECNSKFAEHMLKIHGNVTQADAH